MEIYKEFSLKDLPNEEWRDVVGYEGLYKVSNMGRVKMLPRNVLANKSQRIIPEHIIKQIETQKGYLSVDLWNMNNRKRFMVHRLVLNAFNGKNSDKKECNHKNENRKDNIYTNLEWISHKENINYGSRTEKQKVAMINHSRMSKPIVQYDLNGRFIAEYPSMRQAARELCFDMSNIKDCCKGRYKSTHGFVFKYK